MNATAVALKLDMSEESTVGVKIAVLLSFNSSLNFVETFNIPVPHMIEKVIEVVKFIPQEQVQSRIMEKIIDTPVSQIQETDEVPGHNSSTKPWMCRSSCGDRCPSSGRCRKLHRYLRRNSSTR